MKTKIWIERMKHRSFFVVGLAATVFIVICLTVGPLLIPYDAVKNSLMDRFLPPEWFSQGFSGHIFGTDQMGRDMLKRLLIGGRLSMEVALIVVLIQMAVGVILGVVAGYFGGFWDQLIMRACDVFLAIPNLILAIAIMAVLGNSIPNLVAVLSFAGWVQFCKLTRNNVKVACTMEYVQASKVLGASAVHIMFTQILPNVTTHIIILASQRIGWVILLESSLSFLSLGIPAPTPSWGNMISNGREYLTQYPWMALVPGIALMITVLAFNFLGDGLRDVLDPKRN